MTAKTPKKPPAPPGLGKAGKALWTTIVSDVADEEWELDARDRELLARAAACADDLDQLERAIDRDGHVIDGKVHPAVSEARQQRQLLYRLIASIEMHDPEARKSTRPASVRARRAAQTRWS